MLYYLFVFLVALLVDIIPFVGPPAWVVMVYFQIRYDLNIWQVLIFGVAGSALGRYILSAYMPVVFGGLINQQKKEDLQFIGSKLSDNTWRVQLFVLLYTLVPLPSTPLFTAAGMARIKVIYIIPAFILGKFVSDMIMVLSGDYAAKNAIAIAEGLLSWQSLVGFVSGILIIAFFLFIDWKNLLQNKRFRLSFHIWS